MKSNNSENIANKKDEKQIRELDDVGKSDETLNDANVSTLKIEDNDDSKMENSLHTQTETLSCNFCKKIFHRENDKTRHQFEQHQECKCGNKIQDRKKDRENAVLKCTLDKCPKKNKAYIGDYAYRGHLISSHDMCPCMAYYFKKT